MTPERRNPWGLTKREGDALTALIEYGNGKAAGRALGVIDKTVEGFVNKAKKRMKLESRVQMAVHWDRWLRSPDYVADAPPPKLSCVVADLIERGVATDLDSITKHCAGHSRAQVTQALCNLVADDRIYRSGWAKGSGGRRIGVYSPKLRPSVRRVSSVFEMGASLQ